MKEIIEKIFYVHERFIHIEHDSPALGCSQSNETSHEVYGPYQQKEGALRKIRIRKREYKKMGWEESKNDKNSLWASDSDIDFFIEEKVVSKKKVG